ncbi:MAG: stage V sporulation protein AA [Lachnospiraceae bacterium]|nr:stage V sporulation protein AA [Lachnospiraceae bacterium]
MQNTTLYVKLTQNAEIMESTVYLKDIAKLTCKDPHVLARAKTLKVYEFHEDKRQVISAMKVIQQLESSMPVSITLVGNTAETVIERVKTPEKKGAWIAIKIIFVSMICFWGTAFTVMAFHNDIGINQMFTRIYYMMTGVESNGFTVIEISYSIGLASGIIIFFNHIGKRRITKDPTPVEVEMRIYENDVNTSLVETANREGKTIDVS